MIRKEALGAAGAPFVLDVERGKVLEFARAVHSPIENHSGETPVIPPTFLSTQLFWEKLVPEANPWALVEMSEERGMHAEQEYIFHHVPMTFGLLIAFNVVPTQPL